MAAEKREKRQVEEGWVKKEEEEERGVGVEVDSLVGVSAAAAAHDDGGSGKREPTVAEMDFDDGSGGLSTDKSSSSVVCQQQADHAKCVSVCVHQVIRE